MTVQLGHPAADQVVKGRMFSYNNIIDKREPPNKAVLEACIASASVSDAAQPTLRHMPDMPPGLDAWVVDNFLTQDECCSLIAACDNIGWSFWRSQHEDAPLAGNDGMGDPALARLTQDSPCGDCDSDVMKKARAFRTADTIEVHLPLTSVLLWRRLAPFFVASTASNCVTFNEQSDPETFERDCEGTWYPLKFSEDMLFARYLTDGHFAPHVDGSSIVDFNHRTMYTVLIYLNDCASGGETRMLSGDQCDVLEHDAASGRIRGNGRNVVYDMKPSAGAAIVFRYNVLHEGVAVAEGCSKFILRGDVIYQRRPQLLNDDNDRKAFEIYQRARVLEATGDAFGAASLFKQVRRHSAAMAEVYQL